MTDETLLCSCGKPALIVEDGNGRCAYAVARDAELAPHRAYVVVATCAECGAEIEGHECFDR